MLFLGISAVAAISGGIGGFLFSYKSIIVNYTLYKQQVVENTAILAKLPNLEAQLDIVMRVANGTQTYQQVLRTEVKANAEGKMDKKRAWQQINSLDNRIDYLELHSKGK